MNIQNISVIGSGTMGNGIAHVFALYGYNVTLIDIKQEFLDRSIKTITGNLERQLKKRSYHKREDGFSAGEDKNLGKSV